MKECIFCKIGSGEIPSYVITEDKKAIAFLDIHPCAPGHTVVISRRHTETILDMSSADITALFLLVKNTTKLLKQRLQPSGFTIGINHGSVAGQIIPHLHVHIIPRFSDDGGKSIHSVVKRFGQDIQIEKIYKKIND